MSSIKLTATTVMGLEAITRNELQALGYNEVQTENGKVSIKAEPKDICRLNLWLRTADRVKWVIGEFKATSFDELFEKTKALPWADFLPQNAEFPVVGKSIKSTLYSVPDCQAIVKKAVVESLKSKYNVSWFNEDGPFYKIEVALHKDKATISVDTSGAGLHKRGYRYYHGEAPLKETLAAGLIYLTNWKPDKPFADPFCGAGTIPIEAAMIGQNIAPGFNRSFASEDWGFIGQKAWDEAHTEADDLANYDQELNIFGSDLDHRMVELAEHNAREVGLSPVLNFKQMQVSDFTTKDEYGCMVGNPPYGERMGADDVVDHLYKSMGDALRPLETWSFYFLTPHPDFEKLFGKKASKKRKLYNGRIRTDYYQFFGKRPPKSK